MRNVDRWLVAAAALLVSMATAIPAGAVDLTGTWEGVVKCTGLSDGESIDRQTEKLPLEISQAGVTLNLLLASAVLATGKVSDDASDPEKGMFTMISCDPAVPNC